MYFWVAKMTGWVWMDEARALISRWKLDSLCCTFPNITKFNPNLSNILKYFNTFKYFWSSNWVGTLLLVAKLDQIDLVTFPSFLEYSSFIALHCRIYVDFVSGVLSRLWFSAISYSSFGKGCSTVPKHLFFFIKFIKGGGGQANLVCFGGLLTT